MKKRMLAALLAAAMALSLLPTTAWAEDGGNPPECTCTVPCTTEAKNLDCPVCGAEGAALEACAPNQTVTRQEMAVILSNYAKAVGYEIPKTREAITFADNRGIDSRAAASVKQMQMAGVVNGKDGNKFDPTGAVTRSEASAMLRRYVELMIDPATAQGWDRNDSGKWMYYVNGKPVTGKQTIDDTVYRFSTKGQLTKIDAVGPKTKRYIAYTIKKCDTLWGIAASYNCTVAEIAALNESLLADPNKIIVGQQIMIPQE